MTCSIKQVCMLYIALNVSIVPINALQPVTKAVGRTAPQATTAARRYLQNQAGKSSVAVTQQNAVMDKTIKPDAPSTSVILGQMESQAQLEAQQQNELFKNLVVQDSYQKQQISLKRLEQELKAHKATLKGYQKTAAWASAAALIASIYGGIILFEESDQKATPKPISLAEKYSETKTDKAARILANDLALVLDPYSNFSTQQQHEAALYLEKILRSKPGLKLPLYSLKLGSHKTLLDKDSLTQKIKELNEQLKYQAEAEINYLEALKKEPSKLLALSFAVLEDEKLQGSMVKDFARYNLAKYYMDSNYFYKKNQEAERYLKEIIGQPLITREFESPLKSQAVELLLKLQVKNK